MSTSTNRTTEYSYTLEGQLAVLIARNGVTGDQVTRWHYGTTLAESGVASNSLVRAKVYPESDDAGPGLNGPDGVYDRVEYRYNRQGEMIEQKDQNGTVHAYDYDRLGRPLHDRVTALGTGIDGAVRRISRGYDRAGRLESVGSWSAAGAGAGQVVNQLRLRYNGFGQLIEDSQNHDGAVAPGSTPAVRYQYANGSNRHIRRLSTTYPGGREIEFDYGAAGEADDKLGRVQAIRDASDADKVLARYTRRGLSATMRIEYPTSTEVSPLEMTYIKQPGEPDGDGGDQYTGQDRFNRIIDIRWLRTPTFHVDRFQYGFDRAGNRLWRRNVVAASNWDELYSYDGLYQLPERQRGTLNGTHTGLTGVVLDKEQFTYDPTGNWDRYLTQGTTTLDQSRAHNRANEITEIAGSEAAVGYDRAGNMTRMPRVWSWALPQETTWDAWNRLVKISEGATTVGRYAYDGLTRRVWKDSVEDGTLTRRHFYYSDQWQVLEERTGTSVLADRRFVWGMRYIDDLILRDRVTSPTDTERLYVTHDQWHVTATVGTDGLATERYAYRAFGLTHFLKPDFGPRSASISGWETTYGAYRYDPEAKLFCVRYRYLHSALGRWINRDPKESDIASDFLYVINAPTQFVDILGLTRDTSYLDFSFARDSASKCNIAKAVKKFVRALGDLLKKCCKNWCPLGCNTVIRYNIDPARPAPVNFQPLVPKQAPIPINMFQSTHGWGRKGARNVLITDSIPGPAAGLAGKNTQILLECGTSGTNLGHEEGHVVGLPHQNIVPNDLMDPHGGGNPSQAWCQLVAGQTTSE